LRKGFGLTDASFGCRYIIGRRPEKGMRCERLAQALLQSHGRLAILGKRRPGEQRSDDQQDQEKKIFHM
jgi:hypothetical protein